jgi:phospholipid/cholesterol/gamma-HCH transport system substrate-binding protein
MPRTRSLAWAELKIGLITIFAVFMTAMLIFFLSGQGGFPWQQYRLRTVFDNIAGLKTGAPVRVAGLEVGKVDELRFTPGSDRVDVILKVRKEMQPRITTTSVASLGSVSLLGESAVDITSSTKGTPIPEGGEVPSAKSAGSLSDVATQASAGIDELTGLIKDMRAGKGTLGQLVANDQIAMETQALLASLNDVTRRIGSGRGSVGRLLNDPAAAQALEASLRNLQDITGRIQRGEGSLGKLMTDDQFATSLTGVTTSLDAVMARMNRGEGTLGQLANNRELFDHLNAMSASAGSLTGRLDTLVAGLNQGEGTVGMALKDKQLYENMNAAVVELRGTLQDARSLLAAIQKDPRKYLNIRVSLF